MKRVSLLLRLLGIICVVVGLLDLYVLWRAISTRFAGGNHLVHTTPIVVDTMFFMSALFCCCLIAFGVNVVRSPQAGVRFLVILFSAEIAYVLALLLLPSSTMLGKQVGAAFGLGTVGLYFQVLTALPLWGLTICLIARRIMRSPPGQADLRGN
jgi:hypothetical protein